MPRRFVQQDWAEPDLFIMADETLVESSERASFKIRPLDKVAEPVLRPTERWEGGDGTHQRPVQQDPLDGTVLYDTHEQRYVLWYRSHNRLLYASADPALGGGAGNAGFRPQGSGVCFATSADGLTWHKPHLGRVRFDNSTRNNMIDLAVPPVHGDHLSGVVPVYVDGPGPDLAASVYSAFDDAIYPRGITVLFSDDGLDWRPHFPPTLPLDGDAHCVSWDSRRRCYLCTTRSAQHERIHHRLRQRGLDLPLKRHVALAQSRDLIHWTPLLDVLEADDRDPPNAQLYMMYVLPYGHAYLGFVQLFYMAANMAYGPLDVQLAVSSDLMHWHRVGDRTPILPRGPQGSWDQSHVTLCTNPPFPEGDLMRFWYGGKDSEHWQAGNAALGSATLRRDGFACWEAGDEGGTVTTRPLQMNWATWPMLNIDAPAGEVRLEILTEAGEVIPGCRFEDCRPLSCDALRAPVQYAQGRGTFIRHTGRVRLRFHLRRAKLYAFKLPNTAAVPAEATP